MARVLPQATADLYKGQQRLSLATSALAVREWRSIGEDLDAGWFRIGARLVLLTASGQLGAARAGAAYVPRVLDEQGQSVAPDGAVIPSRFAGVASDGRPLESLLYGAVVAARSAKVDSFAARLDVGASWLDMAVRTQVQDAGRDASAVAVTARPRVRWVRMVNPPCCQRCAVLAGHVYSHSQGFQRHPRCDCQMLPQTIANPNAPGLVIGPDDVKSLTAKQREAIANGADFNKTVNDYQRKQGDYLPPTKVSQITARSGSRAKAVEALRTAGYLAA